MTQQVQKSWADEMLEEGKEIGKEIGKVEGVRDSLRTNLEERFGKLPEDLVKRLAALSDLARLQDGLRQSLKIKSLDELKL